MMCGSRWRAVLAVVLASLPFLVAMSADAQRGRGHATKDAGAAAPSTAHNIQVGSKDGGAGATEGVKANADAGILEAETLDGGARVFRFGRWRSKSGSVRPKSSTSCDVYVRSSRRAILGTEASWASCRIRGNRARSSLPKVPAGRVV